VTIRELHRDRLADERRLPPEMTVALIHHAGGSAAAFLPFVRHLPRRWRLLGLELPARYPSVRQPACRTVDEAVGQMLGALWNEVPGPFAVFGHSMGALLAYELARALERRGRPPVWLGVSASAAPHLATGDLRHRWPYGQLVQFMHRRGTGPDDLWQEPHILERMEHCLRNDLTIVDTYKHRAGPPLGTALSVYSGSADPVVSDADLKPWIGHARSDAAFHTWPGGHFYLFERVDEVCARMAADIRSAMVTAAAATPAATATALATATATAATATALGHGARTRPVEQNAMA
jgi:surfactin synthase thioesterase subunit